MSLSSAGRALAGATFSIDLDGHAELIIAFIGFPNLIGLVDVENQGVAAGSQPQNVSLGAGLSRTNGWPLARETTRHGVVVKAGLERTRGGLAEVSHVVLNGKLTDAAARRPGLIGVDVGAAVPGDILSGNDNEWRARQVGLGWRGMSWDCQHGHGEAGQASQKR